MCFECEEGAVKMSHDKNRVFKRPKETLRLQESSLPELKNLEVGEITTITLKVRMKSKTEGNEWGSIGDGDDDYLEREYGKKYADAKRKYESELKGSFEILDADEDGEDTPEQAAAKKIMADKKRGRIV